MLTASFLNYKFGNTRKKKEIFSKRLFSIINKLYCQNLSPRLFLNCKIITVAIEMIKVNI